MRWALAVAALLFTCSACLEAPPCVESPEVLTSSQIECLGSPLSFEIAGIADPAKCTGREYRGWCDDGDRDGLADGWEAALLARAVPVVRLVHDDRGIVLDDDPLVFAPGRVTDAGHDLVRVFMVLAYPEDYGSCGVTGHSGDTERAVLEFKRTGRTLTMTGAYTAAHENTPTDRSMLFRETDLTDQLRFIRAKDGQLHWMVFASRDKHASYVNRPICDQAAQLICLEGRCAQDDEDAVDVLPATINVGEEEAPLVVTLGAYGFPGEEVWSNRRFCGGREDDGCSSPVRDKLVPDPFES